MTTDHIGIDLLIGATTLFGSEAKRREARATLDALVAERDEALDGWDEALDGWDEAQEREKSAMLATLAAEAALAEAEADRDTLAAALREIRDSPWSSITGPDTFIAIASAALDRLEGSNHDD